MALTRIVSMIVALLCSIRASCNVDSCVRDGTCEDLTGLLQSNVQVHNVMTEGIEEEKEEEDVGEADTKEMEIEEGMGEADVTEMETDEESEGMAAVEPPPFTVVEETGTSNPSLGSSSVCGVGEEIISTNCLGKSLVKEQARATARMMMGGCCTAWLVKAETANQGALMLSTGHCGSKSTAQFDFNYVGACPGGAPASQKVSCNGKRLSVEAAKDEQAIYELDKGCKPANAATPILLDIGRPEPDEGMYILGHPNCRPSLLSHQEAHDDGHHCEVRSIGKWGSGSTRVSYYCDTQGGNSGSPVFSARTGYAFAIHSHGGCSKGQSSKNWGGLLENSGVVAAFKKYGIPFVNRKDTNLFKYENFVHEPQCVDHAQNAELKQKSLAECKKLCVGSLTCVGIEYSASKQTCSVNYRSKKTPSSCQGDAKYYRRTDTLTSTLENAPLPTTPAPPPPAAPGTCGFENMQSVDCKLWSNTAATDDFDWTRATKTPSSNTGPSKAASGSHFMFIETSSPRRVNDKAIYQSSKVTLGSTPSLSFKYHMYGSSIGELKVVVKESGSAGDSTAWKKSGAQGNQWTSAKVALGSFAGKEVSIQFVGIRGSSWAGDIALDDVNLEAGGPAPTSQAPTTQAPTTQAPTTKAPPTQAPTTQAPPTQAPSPPSLDQRIASLGKKVDEILKLLKNLVNQR